jgi:hypothetical protein
MKDFPSITSSNGRINPFRAIGLNSKIGISNTKLIGETGYNPLLRKTIYKQYLKVFFQIVIRDDGVEAFTNTFLPVSTRNHH